PDDGIDGFVLGGGADVDPALYRDTATVLGEVVEASAAAVETEGAPWRSRVYAPAIWLLRKALARPGGGELDAERDALERRLIALHRQAIRTVGRGLAVVAREATGVVQAVERPDHPFRIGVQWHPEYIPQHRRQRGLFEGLVAAASKRSC